MKFDFDDILIVPKVVTGINSRKDVNPFTANGYLPIFTAPMDTVVNDINMKFFHDNKINVVLPRTVPGRETMSTSENCFVSFGLDEFINLFLDNTVEITNTKYVLIDIANGHMHKLVLTIEHAKNKYGTLLKLMVGNIANPETYRSLSIAGADYIRVGIGNGGGCLTTQQTGVGYPMASLIELTKGIADTLSNPAKIVADGGFKKYADIIKALALGADYVMLGSIFNKALESAGENFINDRVSYFSKNEELISEEQYINNTYDERFGLKPEYLTKAQLEDLMNYGKLFKKFRGMSTKEVQKSLGNEVLKTSEGIVKYHKVEYTLNGWVENFEHYLRSAMSYTNSLTLNDFIGEVNTIVISENAFNRYNK